MIALTQSKTALAINLTASFLAGGGTPPYAYSVRAGGAGGSIDSATGLYTAPAVVPDDPQLLFDTVQVTDAADGVATAQIMVGTPLLLFCEVIQNQLVLPNGRVYLWDQKLFQPTDTGLYVAVSVLAPKVFSSQNTQDSEGNSLQSVNMYARLDLDIISRDISAVNRKEEVIMALNSNYSRNQQDANSFYIAPLPPASQFLNLSNQDGSAIPYRFKIAVAIQYVVRKSSAVPYYTDFESPPVTIEP